LKNLQLEHNKKHPKDPKTSMTEFLEFYVTNELSMYKQGNLKVKKDVKSSNKVSKGSRAIDMREAKNRKRVLALQKSSTVRTVLSCINDTLSGFRILMQKIQSIYDLLDNTVLDDDEAAGVAELFDDDYDNDNTCEIPRSSSKNTSSKVIRSAEKSSSICKSSMLNKTKLQENDRIVPPNFDDTVMCDDDVKPESLKFITSKQIVSVQVSMLFLGNACVC